MKKLFSIALVLVMLLCVAASAEGLTKVTLAMPRGLECLDDAHILSGMYLGFFEEEGIELNFVGSTGADIIKLVCTGEFDMGYPAPNYSFSGLAAGMDFVSVFQDGINNIFGIAVLADSGIKEWKDLEGKTIAVSGALSYQTINPMLISAGVDPETVEYIVASEQRSTMLAERQVDAAFTWQKEWQNWKAQGIDIIYLDGDEVVQNVSNSLIVTTDYYENNAETIQHVCNALAKSYYFARTYPEIAAQITVHRYPTLGLTYQEAVPAVAAGGLITADENDNVGYQDIERWKVNLEWAIYNELVEEGQIDLESFLKNDFFEEANAFDRAAIDELAASIDIDSITDW